MEFLRCSNVRSIEAKAKLWRKSMNENVFSEDRLKSKYCLNIFE